MKLPGPDHPITIMPAGKRVRVRFAGRLIADSTRALALYEAIYPIVLYIPRADAGFGSLAAHRPPQPLPLQGRRELFHHRR